MTRTTSVRTFGVLLGLVSLGWAERLQAQPVAYRGFVELRGTLFPQDTATDRRNVVGDLLARTEVFLRPSTWLAFDAGLDFRANTYDQVALSWQPDVADRATLRPRLSVRRLRATVSHGPITLGAGRQFVRWGKTDIVTPTDRFAPRDLVNVLDDEFMGVSGVRAELALGSNAVEAVWVPYFTPSRTPLLTQRWTIVPPSIGSVPLVDLGALLPIGSQAGFRWSHTGSRQEYAVAVYRGFNHLPSISTTLDALEPVDPRLSLSVDATASSIGITRLYPQLTMIGGDAAIPVRWVTLKVEGGHFSSSRPGTDEYVQYVLQLERQSGEWLFIGGYAGDLITSEGAGLTFAPDRGRARALIARASYTIDANRSAALETAVRQSGRGFYTRAEYSRARGQHWRTTVSAVLVRGEADDFLGQYRLNSHLAIALRYSY